ncbi:NADPH-dependent ferric siderophore reductase [Nakamurella sp. UYEF19]|uniref:siderophore-interacting protein n=1 Tax=Nakamurella sp. UYEF19 TaxID=1756392 RepID=UPI0033985236
MTTSIAPHAPYRAFDVEVGRIEHLTPSFVRITFTGTDLHDFADNGNDQRLKLVLPLDDLGFEHFPRSEEWYRDWRLLPEEHRNPIRTYTVRAARPDIAEVEMDLVLHGDGGPASRWAGTARIGDRLVLIGPNRLCPGDTTAAEWRPRSGASLLIGADPTAVPAACAILAELAEDACGVAVLEVPTEADRLSVRAPAGIRVDWRIQDGAPGAALEAGVRAAVRHLVAAPSTPGSDPGAADTDVLWDIPVDDTDGAEPAPLYAWLAGEASAVVRLRRHLVADVGVDRKSLAFMGYWRQGKAEG